MIEQRATQFLIHRVELKVLLSRIWTTDDKMFLIHRVELKDLSFFLKIDFSSLVSNSPCGVERCNYRDLTIE